MFNKLKFGARRMFSLQHRADKEFVKPVRLPELKIKSTQNHITTFSLPSDDKCDDQINFISSPKQDVQNLYNKTNRSLEDDDSSNSNEEIKELKKCETPDEIDKIEKIKKRIKKKDTQRKRSKRETQKNEKKKKEDEKCSTIKLEAKKSQKNEKIEKLEEVNNKSNNKNEKSETFEGLTSSFQNEMKSLDIIGETNATTKDMKKSDETFCVSNFPDENDDIKTHHIETSTDFVIFENQKKDEEINSTSPQLLQPEKVEIQKNSNVSPPQLSQKPLKDPKKNKKLNLLKKVPKRRVGEENLLLKDNLKSQKLGSDEKNQGKCLVLSKTCNFLSLVTTVLFILFTSLSIWDDVLNDMM
ncbi:hypothetical protein EIN_275220 [Entamoeba invadens IP1]|uniref:Uncharacterized protein n=1 Tax=Entamoeba invadens IP1 TaxID=370355 RepID=A0A0A1U1N7_ENTIV|nr:hypothetical protein EIN_275220 [Entamoeba invadens IP1]ELP87935.1 hypothetical protein EIN_275220 [Entamoeba invadens IP1]|eukprot:XP_004254706.1 hypothetical protein EIN_275220 [Entamoeba invadens IP1]